MMDVKWLIMIALGLCASGQIISNNSGLAEPWSGLAYMTLEVFFSVSTIFFAAILGAYVSKSHHNKDRKGEEYQGRLPSCPQCGRGSVQNDETIPPSQTFSDVDGLPVDIASLYDEARASFKAQAYTGCEILCRSILMGVAVDKGAKGNKNFADYVDYLDRSGYVTPPLKKMANTIRENGNKAAHEVIPPDLKRAKGTLTFTRRILDTVYGVEREIDEYCYADQTDSSGSPP